MLAIGLTGGIASGKSVVRRRLEERSVKTLDADLVVHDLFAAKTTVTEALEARFGPDIVTPNGSIDRKTLGTMVFKDEKARKDLEAIVHPAVSEAIDAFLKKAKKKGESLAVVDAALMYETGSYKRYDLVVVTYCPSNLQKERLMQRDHLSSEEADKRIAAQLPIEEKKQRADYVIDTSTTMTETLYRTEELLEALLAESQARPEC